MAYFGWYSANADRQFGHCIYTTEEGIEIKVTEIISSEDKRPIGRWNDYVFVGQVFNCVKTNNFIERTSKSIEDLLSSCQDAIALEEKCKKQFVNTNKCFCFTCPIKLNVN